MLTAALWFVFGAGSCLLLPSGVFAFECAAATFARESSIGGVGRRPRLCIMVPAHDEAQGIVATLRGLKAQLSEGDRLLVIADNCSDNTAELARSAGATVIERADAQRRGKGYAISYGLEHLAVDPPEVVILVDADCEISAGAIDTLARVALNRQRPVQAEYLLEMPRTATPLLSISSLAFLVRNRVRPLGLKMAGFPCHLTGTGMAFPFDQLREAPALGDHLVEDLVMGLEMALSGHAPLFCAEAKVRSILPERTEAARAQRTRWEHGQLSTLLSHGPRLLAESIRQRRPELAVLALDLAVPPLALLTSGLATSLIASGVVGALARKPMLAMMPSMLGLVLIGAGTLAAWFRHGRDRVSLSALALAPLYVAWKIPLYVSLAVRGRQKAWVRTER
ncbi:MAG TPA: glycosyltransferase family 2 protein [Polyangiaceae bacterium]|nr:glycosyltransferase family 2 protein [Polyangiaceae bacterium]